MKNNNNQRPLVSIITANYNSGNLLKITAKSLRDMNFKDYEWIIIDGGSSDSILQIVKDNQDIISHFVSESDEGIYDAWNKGILLSSGNWIAFLGAGDAYLPNALSAYVEAIEKNKEKIDFISSKVRLIRDNSSAVKIIGEKFKYIKHCKYMNIAHVGSLHQRAIFEKFGLFSTSYQSSGDFEFLMRCGAGIKSDFLDMVTVNMMLGGISATSKAIIETYKIKKIYGIKFPIPLVEYWIALFKKFIRSLFLRY